MTDKEKAIVMTYTGVVMLVGDKIGVFHQYVEEKIGRKVYPHELASDKMWDDIKSASFNDFKAICRDEFAEQPDLK